METSFWRCHWNLFLLFAAQTKTKVAVDDGVDVDVNVAGKCELTSMCATALCARVCWCMRIWQCQCQFGPKLPVHEWRTNCLDVFAARWRRREFEFEHFNSQCSVVNIEAALRLALTNICICVYILLLINPQSATKQQTKMLKKNNCKILPKATVKIVICWFKWR